MSKRNLTTGIANIQVPDTKPHAHSITREAAVALGRDRWILRRKGMKSREKKGKEYEAMG
jgi:hypothetical protein